MKSVRNRIWIETDIIGKEGGGDDDDDDRGGGGGSSNASMFYQIQPFIWNRFVQLRF